MTLENPDALYLATDSVPRTRNAFLSWIAEQLGVPTPPFAEEDPAHSRPSERGGNRRYRNDLLLESGYTFQFPTYREGYGALIASRDQPPKA